MIVNIQADLDRLHEVGLLDRLLADKTTKENIIWATDAYNDKGEKYARDAQITSDLITGENSGIIKTRARKEIEQQSERTRQHAEVFTPLWVCNRMNNDIDEVWFSAKDVFNIDGEPTKRVVFPEQKDWMQYVDSRRLEITCGEAPYLVSRYDVESGEILPIASRIGILDRKLRVVNENAANEADWIKWAIRAVQATYGYEFQGDNLLIARTNLVMTFVEYYRAWLGQEPNKPLLGKIVNIVSWNIWQMDGLTDKVPFNDQMKESISLFDFDVTENDIQHCKIYDWRRDNAIKFFKLKNTKDRSTKDRKEVRSMKFDYIIGNPPYQEETQDTSDKPIYNSFMDSTYVLGEKVELISPARFLFDAGKTPKLWNEKMLNDEHLKVLEYWEKSADVFVNTKIRGGICISYHDMKSNFGAIKVFSPFPIMNQILKKVLFSQDFVDISQIMYLQNRLKLDELYKDHPDYRSIIGSNGNERRFESGIFDKIPLFSESPLSEDSIKVYGVVKKKRVFRYFPQKYTELTHGNLNKYKAVIMKSNGVGLFGEIIAAVDVLEPGTGYTQSFIGIGAFEDYSSAYNCGKYLKTKLVRSLLGVKKVTQDNPPDTWVCVPVQDFSTLSDIDWAKSVFDIDKQLYKKYRLDADEIAFIESHVKEMD